LDRGLNSLQNDTKDKIILSTDNEVIIKKPPFF